MPTKKYSQFTPITLNEIDSNKLVTFGDPVAVDNYYIPYPELFPQGNTAGGGTSLLESVVKTTLTFKSLTEGLGIDINEKVAGEVEIAVNPAEIDINAFSGVLSLANGGTGSSLSAPAGAAFLAYDPVSGLVDWTLVGAGLTIGGGTVSANAYYAGTGLTLTGGDTFNVVYGGVPSTAVEGDTQITVNAGTGLAGGGTIILGLGGSVTLTNNDTGSAQNIFKTVVTDSGSLVATSNVSTLPIVGGTNVNTAVVGNQVIINAESSSCIPYNIEYTAVPGALPSAGEAIFDTSDEVIRVHAIDADGNSHVNELDTKFLSSRAFGMFWAEQAAPYLNNSSQYFDQCRFKVDSISCATAPIGQGVNPTQGTIGDNGGTGTPYTIIYSSTLNGLKSGGSSATEVVVYLDPTTAANTKLTYKRGQGFVLDSLGTSVMAIATGYNNPSGITTDPLVANPFAIWLDSQMTTPAGAGFYILKSEYNSTVLPKNATEYLGTGQWSNIFPGWDYVPATPTGTSTQICTIVGSVMSVSKVSSGVSFYYEIPWLPSEQVGGYTPGSSTLSSLCIDMAGKDYCGTTASTLDSTPETVTIVDYSSANHMLAHVDENLTIRIMTLNTGSLAYDNVNDEYVYTRANGVEDRVPASAVDFEVNGTPVVSAGTTVNIQQGTNVTVALTESPSGTARYVISATDTDTTYNIDVPSGTTDIRLVGSDASTDSISLVAGTNVTLTRLSDSSIRIAATTGAGTTQNLWETITADSGSTTAGDPNDTLAIAGGDLLTTSIVGDTVTIDHDNIGTPSVSGNSLDIITSVTTDSVGHITAFGQTSVGPFDNYNNWKLSVDGGTADSILTGQTVNVNAGTNVTLGYTSSTNTLVINATDTNTTYSAGTGLSLVGTTFNNTDPGSAQNIFKNIAVATQSTIIADNNNDTLTIAQANGIELTTNAGSDTLTIDSTIYDIAVPAATTTIRLSGTGGGDDLSTSDITLSAGTGIALSHISTSEIRITNTGSSGGTVFKPLPVPKVELLSYEPGSVIVGSSYPDVTVEWFDKANNNAGGTLTILKAPYVVTMDITDEMITQGVFVEMVYYRGRHGNGKKSYVAPAPYISGANPLETLYGNLNTRCGIHTTGAGPTPVPLGIDKPNHYQVTGRNETINVYEYLNGMFTLAPVKYRDTTGTTQTQSCPVPVSKQTTHFDNPSSRFAYSSNYSPLYIAFRYIMRDSGANGGNGAFISGPLSHPIAVAAKYHPFVQDPLTTATVGLPTCTIHPLFNSGVLNCWHVNRLP